MILPMYNNRLIFDHRGSIIIHLIIFNEFKNNNLQEKQPEISFGRKIAIMFQNLDLEFSLDIQSLF